MARSNSGESVLSRMVRIFEAIDPDTPAITVTELARRADLPTATTWRIVNELVGYGWLRRDGGRIRIGVRMWELAVRASPTLDLREAAMPHMEDLHGVVGHHAQLSVLEHREVLSIERLSARGAVRNLSRVGGRLPLHASASGLVLLAHASAALQESVLADQMRAFTPYTITEPRALRALLSDIRHRGHAYCAGFINEEAVSVAAPVRDRHDRVAAALSVIVPNDPSARRVVPAVAAAALGISQALGVARSSQS
ncbi:IclR family transcriptional regulator [Actinospica sp.]|uniref:IclR family transcriptional regulator n=1 Tax=Actinospica sp. TaxID=1872142 RepID=UPI002C7C4FAA|nr:IclR family transcriptional regulator [Actinospica sp.]HWG25582.1 IclR family transcriptional regulator [Actinospica sp.]